MAVTTIDTNDESTSPPVFGLLVFFKCFGLIITVSSPNPEPSKTENCE